MAQITELSQLDLNGTYSYADYLTWQFDDTVELIRGKIMAMSPAPTTKHQRIVTELGGQLFNYFRQIPCELFFAPFDVRLYDHRKSNLANRDCMDAGGRATQGAVAEDIFTVVQPDLCVVCNREQLDERGCLGAPDWVVEILSAGNSKREMQIKYGLYQESGVKEYWLVYPYEKAVHQFVLDEASGLFQLKAMYAEEDCVSPALFADCQVDLAEVFAD